MKRCDANLTACRLVLLKMKGLMTAQRPLCLSVETEMVNSESEALDL